MLNFITGSGNLRTLYLRFILKTNIIIFTSSTRGVSLNKQYFKPPIVSGVSTRLHYKFTSSALVAGMAKNTPGVLKSGEDPSKVTDSEWKKRLDEEKYYVLREQGTERPFTGEYTYTTEDGMYHCGCCGVELFSSGSKFESHCGWPAFSEVLGRKGKDETDSNIIRLEDNSNGMNRVEVRCKKCDGHLGHVFEDGPFPTGERFCINSLSMDFVPKKKKGSKV